MYVGKLPMMYAMAHMFRKVITRCSSVFLHNEGPGGDPKHLVGRKFVRSARRFHAVNPLLRSQQRPGPDERR